MKTFYTSIALFILMIAFILINASYINRTVNELTEITHALPSPINSNYDTCINDLKEFWEQNYTAISFSVCMNDLNKISDSISQLKAYSTNQNEQDFEATRKILINAINNMCRLEKISWDSIM